MRIKPKKRIVREKPEPFAEPEAINRVWSMDFMHDQLRNGRSYRLFNVTDNFNRGELGIEVDFSLPAERVIRSLEQIIEWRGKPRVLRYDNGPEDIRHRLQAWAGQNDIELAIFNLRIYNRTYIERYNRTVRYDCLCQYLFESIDNVQAFATKWIWTYNNE